MDVGLLYFIPKNGKKYVSFSFLINLFTSGLTIILLMVIAKNEVRPYLGLVWLMSAEQLFFSIYRARQHIKEFFRIKALVDTLLRMVIFSVLYWIWGPRLGHLILASYLSALVAMVIYFKDHKDMFGKIEMEKEFISYSATIILGGVMSLLINYIDIIMIEAMLDKKSVALYRVGTELALLPSMFLRIVNTVFPPVISKLYHEGKVAEVRQMYEKLTRWLFFISSITIGLILLLWHPILSLYGPEYLEAKMVLIYRAVGQLVNASVGSVWYIVLMTGHPKIRFVGVFLSAVINVSLNYLLIPIAGIDGAALASMVSVIFINLMGYFVVKRILGSKVYYII
jgi:O-antigen/teichoic acid export membrane protein